MKVAALLLALMAAAAAAVSAEEFDFFYLVQQWPGSYCDTERGCCFPDSGKPAADFGIHGLWPNYAHCGSDDDDGGNIITRRKCWPENCNDDNPLQLWEIRDLVKELDRNWPTLSCRSGRSFDFWRHEWRRHGTCSDLGQHGYFKAALDLKRRHNLTAILAGAGIVPSDGETYFLSSIRDAIREATGKQASLECNRGASGEAQLYQVYQCVGRDGKTLVDCKLPMRSRCDDDRVKLPTF